MNSRLLISQSQKGNGNDHKADAGNGWGPNFPFSSKIDQINTEEHKQVSSNNKSSISFHIHASDFFIF